MTAIAVHLHGGLSRFGGPYMLHVDTVGEAVRALCVQLRGLRQAIEAGAFRVIRCKRRGAPGLVMGPEDLPLRLGRARELHLVPVVHGKGRGVGKIILGTLLIAASFIVPGSGIALTASISISAGQVLMFGASMVLAGVSQMLSPQPKAPKPFEPADRRPSFLFEQPVNVSAQGSVIPLAYGRFRVGSVVVSASLESEDYSSGQGSVAVPTIVGGKTGVLTWLSQGQGS